MRVKEFEGGKRFLSLIFVFVLLVSLIHAPLLKAGKADCEKALAQCGFTASLSALGNPAVGAALGAGCLIGYAWCLEFFK
ncbi:hypothetical protein KGY73_08305 [bacterium]|nr:hypothetical protein [bacterium]